MFGKQRKAHNGDSKLDPATLHACASLVTVDADIGDARLPSVEELEGFVARRPVKKGTEPSIQRFFYFNQ